MKPLARLLPYISLTAFTLLVFRQVALSNLIFARGDMLLYFYPYWDFRAQTLLAGQLPLWNPFLFMGVPFLANSQAGVFYPLNLPLIIFSAPQAVKISLVVHTLIAAWGVYALARRTFLLAPFPATFAAALFALGGYLTAQVEHVNQLQGLAWMPWALLAMAQSVNRPLHSPAGIKRQIPARLPSLLALALVLALQLTAGHTQTTFITLLGCGIVLLHSLFTMPSRSITATLFPIVLAAVGVALALGLSAVQLLPTYELSQLSLRGGGLPLNEAVSFSLNPLLLGRALLPGYSRLLYSEFVAHTGVVPLMLTLASLVAIRRGSPPPLTLAGLLAVAGLFLAFGGYSPLYLLLVKFAPGFNLFRGPARWLALWALGSALLAGLTLQSLGTTRARSHLVAASVAFAILLALTFIAAPITPAGELGPVGTPAAGDVALWLGAFVIAILLISKPQTIHWAGLVLASVSALEILGAGRLLSLNQLTTPDAYFSVRPAMTQLLAAQRDTLPPARFLSLSALTFDPGDLAELRSALEPQLPPAAVYDAIIATKHKEVLSPNLPLTWGIPAVDGFDGGILPLRQFAQFAAHFGNIDPQTDGRLRQSLTNVPPNWLLNLTNTRWVVTDKDRDQWVDGVFYDLQFQQTVSPQSPLVIDIIPQFEATTVGLVIEPSASPTGVIVTIALQDGTAATLPLTADSAQPALRASFASPNQVASITIEAAGQVTVRGASLIDERVDAFHALTLGPYRLVHSGDVKIYENLNVLPRAFLVADTRDMQQPALLSPAPQVLKYETGHVVISTTSNVPGYLILTDVIYPGWVATLDRQPVEIMRAFELFRAVAVPAGSHIIEFNFQPASLRLGGWVSLVCATVVAALSVAAIAAKRAPA